MSKRVLLSITCLLAAASIAGAETVPISYQGRLNASGQPFAGTADFQVSIHDASTGGNPIGATLDYTGIPVMEGLFTLELPLDSSVFQSGAVRWIEIAVQAPTGAGGYVTLTPRQRITHTPYAVHTRGINVDANGNVGIGTATPSDAKLDLVGDMRLNDFGMYLRGGSDRNHGLQHRGVFGGIGLDGPALFAHGAGVLGTTFGTERVALRWGALGDVRLMGPVQIDGGNTLEFGFGVEGKQQDAGKIGYQSFSNGLDIVGAGTNAADRRIQLWAEGGTTFIGNVGVGVSDPAFPLAFASNVGEKISLWGGPGNSYGFSIQPNALQIHTSQADADIVLGSGPSESMNETMRIKGNGKVGIGTSTPGARLDVAGGIRAAGGAPNGDNGYTFGSPGDNDSGMFSSHDGLVEFYSNGVERMRIAQSGNVGIGTIAPMARLDVNGTARVKVLQVIGGADLAEPYDVADVNGAKPEPGMLVSIDPSNIGRLRVAAGAYERTVAGIISGANGINPGLILRQEGTIADGEWPVATAGRVWCVCDADVGGAINPGDLITTSATPGHGMRADDDTRLTGAVVGKAMSGLKSGRGLVLVLVSLQ